MRQHRGSEDAKDGKKDIRDDVVMVTVPCDGECSRCPNASATEVQVLAGGEKTVCRFGWKYLRTDAPLSDLYGVREANALGDAAKAARANRERKSDSVASAEPSEARILSAQAPTFGTLAGRGEGNTNAGRNERRKQVDWRTENAKDMQLLNLRGVAPLDASAVAADGDLVGVVKMHNARLVRAVDRLRRLASDRERLANFDTWQQAESADIATARCRVRREAWDAILEVRRVLDERQAILGQMQARLGERCDGLDEAHSAAVAAAEKRLARERRRMERANFATAGSHFADLVAGQKPVAEAAEVLASAREALESVSVARQAVGGDLSAVAARQREVFAKILAW
jgi:hypothetical protein